MYIYMSVLMHGHTREPTPRLHLLFPQIVSIVCLLETWILCVSSHAYTFCVPCDYVSLGTCITHIRECTPCHNPEPGCDTEPITTSSIAINTALLRSSFIGGFKAAAFIAGLKCPPTLPAKRGRSLTWLRIVRLHRLAIYVCLHTPLSFQLFHIVAAHSVCFCHRVFPKAWEGQIEIKVGTEPHG